VELGRFLRKDDIKDLRERVEKSLALGQILVPRGSKVEGFSFKGGEVFSVDDEPSFFVEDQGTIIPLLVYALEFSLPLPRITVDMRAVAHVCNGADVFRPGVRSIDASIRPGQTVIVLDEKNLKPICIGTSLMEATLMQETKQGKVVKNMHYVGDDLWNFSRSLNKGLPRVVKTSP
jgi:PUA domain protein